MTNEQKTKIDPSRTTVLYLLILVCYAFSRIDTGIFSVVGSEIQKDLGISETEYGLLISILYVGNVVGSIICPFLFMKIHPKKIVVLGILLNGIAVGTFVVTSIYEILLVARFFVGFFLVRQAVSFIQVIQMVFFPVWIDQCAGNERKTVWLSLFFGFVAVGVILGYGLGIAVTAFTSWSWAFLFETVFLVVLSVLFAIFPAQYFETPNGMDAPIEHGGNVSKGSIKEKPKQGQASQMLSVVSVHNQSHQISNDLIKNSIISHTFRKGAEAQHQQPQINIMKIVWSILINPTFMLTLFSLTNILFIIVNLQYYATSYMIHVLGGDETIIQILFSITLLPIGTVLGGFITTKVLGSYTHPKAIILCLVMFCIFIASLIPAPFINNAYAFLALVWLAAFTQGFIEPVITGIYLNAVTPIERQTASSFAIFFMIIFGYVPGPYIYSFVNSQTEVLNSEGYNISRDGMKVTSFLSVLGGLALAIAIMIRRCSKKRAQERMKKSLKESKLNLSIEEIDELVMDHDEVAEKKGQHFNSKQGDTSIEGLYIDQNDPQQSLTKDQIEEQPLKEKDQNN